MKPDPTDPNRAALYHRLFQKAVVWELVRPEDLTRFGVSRDGVRHAISLLTAEERRVDAPGAARDVRKQDTDWTSDPICLRSVAGCSSSSG